MTIYAYGTVYNGDGTFTMEETTLYWLLTEAHKAGTLDCARVLDGQEYRKQYKEKVLSRVKNEKERAKLQEDLDLRGFTALAERDISFIKETTQNKKLPSV